MLYVTEYRLRPHLTRADSKELLEEFNRQGGQSPGEVAHYLRLDGSGGTVVSESDDVEALHRYLLAFGPWLEFTVTPARTIQDGLGAIVDYLSRA